MTEKQIENEILSLLRFAGIFAWKNQSVGIYDTKKRAFRKVQNIFHITGTFDIIGVHQGVFIAIEVKTKTGRLSEAQQNFMTRVHEEGGIAFIARSGDSALKQLAKAFPENQLLKDVINGKVACNH